MVTWARRRSTTSQLPKRTSTGCIKNFCAYSGLENDRFHNAWMRKTYSLSWPGCSLLSVLATSCWRKRRLWRSPSTSLCSRCVRTTESIRNELRISPMHNTPPRSELPLPEPSTSISGSALLMSLVSFSHFPERAFRHTVGLVVFHCLSQLSRSSHRTTES